MSEASAVIWNLKAGSDRRFRAGHPWVYSNELARSPKGISPGALIELRDAAGGFLARGYGNPASLIAFRELSRSETERDPAGVEALTAKLVSAVRLRVLAGLGDFSFRLCFGEADGLPGLIVDRYVEAPEKHSAKSAAGVPEASGSARQGLRQVLVTQAQTAGSDVLQGALDEALRRLPDALGQVGISWPAWQSTAWVVRNDAAVRKLEGLAVEPPRVAWLPQGWAKSELEDFSIWVAPGVGFFCDLFAGQKTGFFLDQGANVSLAIAQALPFARGLGRPVRILDLCCYVGQWSTRLASVLGGAGIASEVTLVDASAAALERARRNVSPFARSVRSLELDVVHGLNGAPELVERSFDIVISDPPALVKGRKDLPQGRHAYLQLHTQALRLLAPSSLLVACSCSGSLEEEDFLGTLAKAARRNSRRVRWTARGAHSPDHPALAEFPEGRYLKCWIGFSSE
jgi:23S rRNA (cytosine1962-C5)-methyltransferase